MPDFDFEKIKRDAEEFAKEAEKKYIRDKRMEHVADISKNLKPISPDDFSKPTKEQKEKLKKQEAKDGKIVLNDENKSSRKPIILVVEPATINIMEKHRFLTLEETEEIWYYKDGAYVRGGEKLIEKEAQLMFDFDLKNSHIAEIKGQIMRRTYHKKEELDADINIINLKNGLYDVEKDLLMDHTPDYLSTIQKPFPYDNTAIPNEFVNFLTEILYRSDIRTIVELFAYSFHRDNPFEIITTLLGFGSNGKNVLLGILTALHGNSEVSNVSMKSILEERFALQMLEGKSVNIDTELSAKTINDTSTLKKLTGRQPVYVERKNKDPYEVKLYAKPWFNANKMPSSVDDSDAYYRRNIIINLPNQFVESKNKDDESAKIADTHKLDKLTTEKELSAIFNMLMVNLRLILKRDKIYVREQSIQERKDKYSLALDPLSQFLEDVSAEDSTLEDFTTKDNLYKAYVKFCKMKRLMVISKSKFGSMMKYRLSEDRLGTGKREYVWKGIKLTQMYLLEDGQTVFN